MFFRVSGYFFFGSTHFLSTAASSSSAASCACSLSAMLLQRPSSCFLSGSSSVLLSCAGVGTPRSDGTAVLRFLSGGSTHLTVQLGGQLVDSSLPVLLLDAQLVPQLPHGGAQLLRGRLGLQAAESPLRGGWTGSLVEEDAQGGGAGHAGEQGIFRKDQSSHLNDFNLNL